jgi:hypothetical protein
MRQHWIPVALDVPAPVLDHVVTLCPSREILVTNTSMSLLSSPDGARSSLLGTPSALPGLMHILHMSSLSSAICATSA